MGSVSSGRTRERVTSPVDTLRLVANNSLLILVVTVGRERNQNVDAISVCHGDGCLREVDSVSGTRISNCRVVENFRTSAS